MLFTASPAHRNKSIKQLCGILRGEKQMMDTMNVDHDAVEGQEVKNLLTRFYYRSSQLCFQLVIELKSGDHVSYSEFNNYNVFKEALDSLQLAASSGALIHIPKN